MRLDDFDPGSVNVEDQRGGGLPIGGAGGKLGCGTMVIALIGALVFGVDPGADARRHRAGQQQRRGPVATAGRHDRDAKAARSSGQPRNLQRAVARSTRPGSRCSQQANIAVPPPKLVFYSQTGRSGCGAAQSAMGPFYCPSRQRHLHRHRFLPTRWTSELGAGGDFARAYVIAHEYGHHIQTLTGCRTRCAARSSRTRAGQPAAGAHGAAGRLLCRRLGGAATRTGSSPATSRKA